MRLSEKLHSFTPTASKAISEVKKVLNEPFGRIRMTALAFALTHRKHGETGRERDAGAGYEGACRNVCSPAASPVDCSRSARQTAARDCRPSTAS